MMLVDAVQQALSELYDQQVDAKMVQVQPTRKEFEGDKTVVVFPFLRMSKKGPEQTAEAIGTFLVEKVALVEKFNVVKGFLNLSISASYWLDILSEAYSNSSYGLVTPTDDSELVMVEYSSPNTNKPLHLGHIRNNLLGYSISTILEATGKKVVKTNIVNDRGIHICKSMYAWQQYGNGETPESTGKKGDHLVGEYYVKFDKVYKQEIAELIEAGKTKEEAEQEAPSIVAARDLLRKWEANDADVRKMWADMNSWVYAGFDTTYKQLGVDFDKIYYESDTYLTGRDEALRGLEEGTFTRREDGSVWANLEAEGLDEKILLRSDGTSVYMTQDIGTAKLRYSDYSIDKMVYVVGNEQNYHFQVLSIVLDKLGYDWGKDLYHFSYGMVELPQGKMKSREGTVVDADDLMAEMIAVARNTSEELGKLDGFSDEERNDISRMIALGALKYFILKVDPKKTMMFNPEESIDFNGNTGPFIQYTHARINSVLRKAADRGMNVPNEVPSVDLLEKEVELLKMISTFPDVVQESGRNYSPAIIANYCYDLVKSFNQFYHDVVILGEEDEQKRSLRLMIAQTTGQIIKTGMSLLGIECPTRM